MMKVIVTYESYVSDLVGTRKQKGLESLSENREWRRRCDVERQVAPDGGTRNQKRPLADCRETNGWNFQMDVVAFARIAAGFVVKWIRPWSHQ